MGSLWKRSLISLMGVIRLQLLRILCREHSSWLPVLGIGYLWPSSIRQLHTTKSIGM